MSDAAQTPGGGDTHQPTVEQAALSAGAPAPPSSNGTAPPAPVVASSDRPELVVGAAFAGGFALAILLRRLGR